MNARFILLTDDFRALSHELSRYHWLVKLGY